jgi:hypothetical protein
MSGGISGFGVSASFATAPQGNLDPQPYPPPGCKSIIESNSSNTTASASVGFVSASGSTATNNSKNTVACNPGYENEQVNTNNYDKSTTINKNVMLMTRNSLKAISESSNQMITNSLMTSKSSANQNVTLNQTINIKVSDVGGDVLISDLENSAQIDLTNIANISFSGFDDVKTDLATSVLQQFKTNTNQESMDTMSADIQTTIANQNNAAMASTLNNNIEQTKISEIPSADPTQIIPTNDTANIKIKQATTNNIKDAQTLNGNYTNEISTDKIMESHISNAVTQNFTKESLNQLSQIINNNQSLKIDVEGVGGNVIIKNLKNTANIVLRQTMTSKVDFGTAIVNSVQNSLGIVTDDTLTTKNVTALGLTSKFDLRNGNTSEAEMKSEMKYKQTISQGFGMGSCGSSFSSFSSCICCIICILSCGLGAASSMIPPVESGESSQESSEQGSSEPESAELPKSSEEESPGQESSEQGVGSSVGGYYYFD